MSVLVFADPAVESSDRATRAQVHVREAFTYGFKSLDDDLVLGVEVVPHDHEPILVQEVKVDEMHKLFLHSVSHVLRVAEHELELLPVLLNFAPGSVVKNITSNVPTRALYLDAEKETNRSVAPRGVSNSVTVPFGLRLPRGYTVCFKSQVSTSLPFPPRRFANVGLMSSMSTPRRSALSGKALYIWYNVFPTDTPSSM
mmetsp:Transcript_37571/g.81443  ORF Transcript_37571/g.81443 Transcript_37571/m.81443 type:complete len:199 (+) Transcript_37571:127-723(+)